MFVRALLLALALILTPVFAQAQPVFGNPFAEVSAYRSERGDLTEARYRARYEATLIERGGAPVVSELAIDAASDWALVRQGERTTLYDFRLNRVFSLGGENFTTANGMGLLVFRVMERQNRGYLQRLMSAAGAQGELPDACDAESELALVMPGGAGATQLRERRGAFTLRCANRAIGGFTPGDGAAGPAALWPTMYVEMPTHPALHRRVRETGRAPAQMEISYRQAPGAPTRRAWRLIGVETVAIPYPLTDNLRNATAAALDALAPGVGQIGAEAVAGRAMGGAPTLESWDRHLRALARSDGEAAAAMLVLPSYNMFPELACDGASTHYVCDLNRRLRVIAESDPAPFAIIEVAGAEQRRDPGAAIAAMQRVQSSRHRDHPALGASFALALLQFNQENVAQARAANLPTDVAALQNRALLALPYNPAYWTDAGDRFGRNYEWLSAFMFYDVAYSLPMPNAVAQNPALAANRTQMERIRRDFPDALLAAPARP